MERSRQPISRTFKKFGLFEKLPTITTGCQFVTVSKDGIYRVFPLDVQPRAAELRAAAKVYEVHTAPDVAALSGDVASKHDTFSFQLQGTVSYQIADPTLMIKRLVTDTQHDVVGLVREVVSAITRNWEPQRVQEAQEAVQRVVEGKERAAAQLSANGYTLSAIQIRLLRDERLRSLAAQAELTRAEQPLQEARRQLETQQVAHIEQIMAGGIYRRMAYFASQGGANLDKAIDMLEQRELEELAGQIKIIESMTPELLDYQQKKLFEDIRGQLTSRFASSKALQSETLRKLLTDPTDGVAPPPAPTPPDY